MTAIASDLPAPENLASSIRNSITLGTPHRRPPQRTREPDQTMTHAVDSRPGASRFLGWRMLALAFVSMNCSTCIHFGIYSTLVIALQAEFDTTRAMAASGTSMMTLALGLVSPLVGTMLRYVSLRTVMVAGAVANASGLALLSVVESIEALLAVYALIIGPGVAMMNVVPSSTLINNWFVQGRGRALGVLNMPLLVFVMPPISAAVLSRFGIDAVFLLSAAITALAIPALMFVIAEPEDVGQTALGADKSPVSATPGAVTNTATIAPKSALAILATPAFLVLSLCVGITTAAGVMMATHVVPLAVEKGLTLQAAAMLPFAFGVAATLGAFLFGWLADRIGGPRTMALQALLWMLFSRPSLLPLAACVAMIGLCSGGIVGLSGVIMNLWMGKASFSRSMGYLYLLKVPFLFGAAPLAGHLFDRNGSYDSTILLHIASFVLVGVVMLVYRPSVAPTAPRAA
jgi:MFS family permease